MPLFRRAPAKSDPPCPPEGKAPPERKVLSLDPQVYLALTGPGQAAWSGRGALAREGFARNPIAYRCIRMIAEAAASAPLMVFADETRAEAGHALQMLLGQPNPEQSGADLMECFFGGLETTGDAYLEAVGDAQPEELYVLRPDRMQVAPGPRGWPEAYLYQANGKTTRLMRRGDGFMPVLHLKLYNPSDDHYGFPPLAAASMAVDIHNASSAWNKALLDNAARPSGALVYTNAATGDRMSEDQFDKLRTQLDDLHSGVTAAGRPMLLEGGLDWKPMALTPAEMDFIEGKHVAAREIALAFGVPPQLLGIPGDATYNTYREAQAAFWRQTVVPLADKAARALTGWLGPLFDGARVAVDLDQVPALATEREALWSRLEAASFLTLEERRRMAGLGASVPDELGPDSLGEVDHD